MEGTHRELGAGLADRLCSDDANGLAHIDKLAGGHRAAVAHGTRAHAALAGENRAHTDGLCACSDKLVNANSRQLLARMADDLAVHLHVTSQGACDDRALRVIDDAHPVSGLDTDDSNVALVSSTIHFANDHVLRDVDQSTGQITGVRRAKRGIGQTLASTVGGDEVLQNRQAFAEVGLDRARDDLALWVGHQTAHTGDLTHLHEVTASTGVDHHVHRVRAREVIAHGLGDLVGRECPDLDELLTTLGVGDQATLVLLLNLGCLLLRDGQECGLLRRGDDVRDRDGDSRAGRPVEAQCLQLIERVGDINLGVALGQAIDRGADDLLVDMLIHEGVIVRQRLVEQSATQRGVEQERLARQPTVGSCPTLRRQARRDADLDRSLQIQGAVVEREDSLGDRAECATFAHGTGSF